MSNEAASMANLGFVFPGQGSQAVGMLADLSQSAIARDSFAQASDVLGYDLWDLVQSDEDGKLNQTHMTQPAILTASVTLWRLWQDQTGTVPLVMAGHSLGEYSALVCAGALRFGDAVDLVKCRGEYMQAAVPDGEGAMAAIIGLDDDAIMAACADAAQGDVVAPVNFNSPGQVVIAGQTDAVSRAMEACKEHGAKRALPLPVSVPSHCALMRSAAQQLATKLDSIELAMPTIPVIHNVNAQVATSEQTVRDNLVAQLHQPVLWTQCVSALAQQGCATLLECGPGKVLTGLTKRIDKSLGALAIHDGGSLTAVIDTL